MTPDEELDEIFSVYFRWSNWDGQTPTSKADLRQAIKEWSCRQRGCEPERIKTYEYVDPPEGTDDHVAGRGIQGYTNGPCIHCGKEET